MKTGEYDGVSASGDATPAADRRRRRRAGQHRPDPELHGRLRRPEEPAPQHGQRRRLRRAPRPRREPADVRHRRSSRRRPTAGASSSTAASPYKGKVTRLRLRDLHRRRRAVPDGDQARPRDHEPVRARRRPSSRPRSTCSRRSSEPHRQVLGHRPGGDRRRSPTATWRSARPGSTRRTCSRRRSGQQVEVVKPKEGTTGWSDTWMISSKAKHPNCMYKWMDYIISPEANAEVDRLVRRGAGQRAGLRRGREAVAGHCEQLPRDRRGVLQGRLVLEHADARRASTAAATICKDFDAWTKAWTEITGG